ncbi:MAG: DNA translocase FtsK [Anaerolineae bacterium]|jgi:S-DNA-T family DNA segregation ATPase FtsK/SpoIIIE|nr:DNA translocase FtsK [Anaerolineae bacterium]MBT4310067.1 DNA translocase FtsK [Anaerolineae bacterium]MBT4457606.1 DNA translocase FtsK [Anaerolineae bacterium]MBT4841101.1 DNA translocase FtsK [Anaerolineae bacterium]MBT6062292.1 DNA translocase FtsK [Anaerolineae bacterium]
MAKKKTPKKKTSQRNKKQEPAQQNFWQRLSINRRLDLIGTVLALLGLLTFLTLASITRSSFTDLWVVFLMRAFGWGEWFFPAGLIIIGVWLVARNQENIPHISIERVTGLSLLFFWLLAIFQLLTVNPIQEVPFIEGRIGGGYLGALFMRVLWGNFGGLGTTVIFLAWLLIGMTMVLDLSIHEFFERISPPFMMVYQIWKERLAEARAARFPEKEMPSVQMNGYTKIEGRPDSVSTPQVQLGVPAEQPIEWQLPPISAILDSGFTPSINEEFIEARARLIEETLESFGAPVQVVEINRGPTITQFGVEPGFIQTRKGQTRVRVNKITTLSDDLALALSASRIRIEAPVPGKGYIGIEVPNEEMTLVALRDILESDAFKEKEMPLGFALGRDVAGHPQVTDLTAMPHLLIAGTTGSGKSVCINAILTSMLLNNTPDDLRLVLVDPKRVELTGYNGIPHLLSPVVVETEKVVGALQWMTREMDKRYHAFSQTGVRNVADYNERMKEQGGKKFPLLVIVIDELADLMMIAPDETERTITRLAQLARATGIHMILATQRPSTDVVTGLIKANFPARIAFAVASGVDSRVILDQSGAERLLGSGDMLYQAPDAPAAARLQGVFISDLETDRLVEFWRMQMEESGNPERDAGTQAERLPNGVPLKQVDMFEDEMNEARNIDPLYDESVELVRRQGRASVSMLQRKLRIGYTRASRLMDAMEDEGIVSTPTSGTGVRDVLDYGKTAPPAEG